jgi:hypothetical protein
MAAHGLLIFVMKAGMVWFFFEKEKLSQGYDQPPLILVFMLKHSLKVLMWRILSVIL